MLLLLLSIIIFLPMVSAACIFLTCPRNKEIYRAKQIAIWTSITTLILVLVATNIFSSQGDPNMVTKLHWAKSMLNYELALDGVNLSFLIFGSLVFILALYHILKDDKENLKGLIVSMLVLQTSMNGVFLANDLLMFFIFIELAIIPAFVSMLLWGEEEDGSFMRYLIISVGSSVSLLISIITIYVITGTTSLSALKALNLESVLSKFTEYPHLATYIWLGFLITFLFKLPMPFLHTWIIRAYSKAPVALMIALAGAVKIGAFGLIKYLIFLFPQTTMQHTDTVLTIISIGFVYMSVVTLAQGRLKLMMLYSSVAHAAFAVFGIASRSVEGLDGAILSINIYGVVLAVLLYLTHIVDKYAGTDELNSLQGIARRAPFFSFVFMVCMLATVGLPGLATFVPEFLVMIGVASVGKVYTAFAASTLVLSAMYMIYLYARIIFGGLVSNIFNQQKDLTRSDKNLLSLFVFLIIFLGIYPDPVLTLVSHSAHYLISMTS